MKLALSALAILTSTLAFGADRIGSCSKAVSAQLPELAKVEFSLVPDKFEPTLLIRGFSANGAIVNLYAPKTNRDYVFVNLAKPDLMSKPDAQTLKARTKDYWEGLAQQLELDLVKGTGRLDRVTCGAVDCHDAKHDTVIYSVKLEDCDLKLPALPRK